MKELKNAGLINNSVTDLALFVKENFPEFANTPIGYITDSIHNGKEPSRGSTHTVEILKELNNSNEFDNEIKDKIEFFPIAVLGLLPAAGSSSSLAGATLDAGAAAATTGNSIPHPSQNLFSPGTKPVPHILHFI